MKQLKVFPLQKHLLITTSDPELPIVLPCAQEESSQEKNWLVLIVALVPKNALGSETTLWYSMVSKDHYVLHYLTVDNQLTACLMQENDFGVYFW